MPTLSCLIKKENKTSFTYTYTFFSSIPQLPEMSTTKWATSRKKGLQQEDRIFWASLFKFFSCSGHKTRLPTNMVYTTHNWHNTKEKLPFAQPKERHVTSRLNFSLREVLPLSWNQNTDHPPAAMSFKCCAEYTDPHGLDGFIRMIPRVFWSINDPRCSRSTSQDFSGWAGERNIQHKHVESAHVCHFHKLQRACAGETNTKTYY